MVVCSMPASDTSSDAICGVQGVLGNNSRFDLSSLGSYFDKRRMGTIQGDSVDSMATCEMPIFLRGVYFPIPIIPMHSFLENIDACDISSDVTSDMLELAKTKEAIADECIEFCEAQNVTDAFDCCMRKVKAVFKSAKIVQAELCCFYDDEEFDNESHVEIEVTINATWEIAESYYDEWINWFVRSVPDSVRKFFILTINRE